MIGGIDAVLENPRGPRPEALEAIVRGVFRRWRAAVVENAETGERYETLTEIPFGSLTEFFVYEDAAALESWNRNGADAENANRMVHILAGDSSITIVVDSLDDTMGSALVRDARQAVKALNWIPIEAAA